MKFLTTLGILALLALPSCLFAADDGKKHPHHLALGTGVAWHDSKSSMYLGADYLYSLNEKWAVGGYYEEVNGDFDLQVWGLLFSRKFGHGWKFNFGPGVERKLSNDKTYYLLRTQLGYDWHQGHWSWGPIATVDFIENGHTTYYLGFTLGFGW